jgi:Trypsin-like peptidase domain
VGSGPGTSRKENADMNHDDTKQAVIRVGGGRGFVIDGEHDRLVITAAHCLPSFPPCHSASYLEERTYPKLLGPLGGEPTVWAECLFVDPIADIAVLRGPDGQELYDEAAAYDALVEAATPLRITGAKEDGKAWLLSLDGKWFQCGVRCHSGGPLWIYDATDNIMGGMSGSPILNDNCEAIGVACVSAVKGPYKGEGLEEALSSAGSTEGGPNPNLVSNLPGWLIGIIVRSGIESRVRARA